jgi:hypothetical protein
MGFYRFLKYLFFGPLFIEKVYPKEIPVPPPDSSKLLGPKRKVLLTRRPESGFGFSLRRSTISERDQTRRTVLFAEPGTAGCGLLPGDRLLEIDGADVEHAQQEEAVVKIKEWIHESANLSKIQKCQINLIFAKAKKILAKNRVCQIIEFEESAICVILNSNSASK